MSSEDYAGSCAACGGQMYQYEVVACPACGAEVHRGCLVNCAHCNTQGCKDCMIQDEATLEYFCDTAGPEDSKLPKSERLEVSACKIAFDQENEE